MFVDFKVVKVGYNIFFYCFIGTQNSSHCCRKFSACFSFFPVLLEFIEYTSKWVYFFLGEVLEIKIDKTQLLNACCLTRIINTVFLCNCVLSLLFNYSLVSIMATFYLNIHGWKKIW